jgi:hypothetical protein
MKLFWGRPDVLEIGKPVTGVSSRVLHRLRGPAFERGPGPLASPMCRLGS